LTKSPERKTTRGSGCRSKDVAAGAVLISAIGSVIAGALVFGPRLAGILM
jgi:diacylglycerol kinase